MLGGTGDTEFRGNVTAACGEPIFFFFFMLFLFFYLRRFQRRVPVSGRAWMATFVHAWVV